MGQKNICLFHGSLVTTNRVIHTPSAFAKKSLLYLQEVGTLQARKQHISQRKHLQSFLFFIVTSGTGSLMYDGKNYSLLKNDCVFLNCQKPYFHKTSESLWSLSWVHFNGWNMKDIYEKYLERGGKNVFHQENILEYCSIINDLIYIAKSDSFIKDLEINEKITEMITYLMKETITDNKKDSKEKITLVQGLKRYLDVNFKKNISLDELSSLFSLNKYSLIRNFKKKYGFSIDNYLLNKRINKAKELLRFSQLSIEEISKECGFYDQNYFSRVFKKVEGESPTKYRKEW